MGRSPGWGLCTVTAIAQGCRALWEDLWLGLHPGLTSPVSPHVLQEPHVQREGVQAVPKGAGR